MTDYGLGWHTRGQGGTRGPRGAPGGSRLPTAPKRVIKQQNNDPKPWFKVPKVCCDPKRMVFTHFWGIWGHLDALKQRYLMKTPICQKPCLTKKIIWRFTQPTWCKILKFSQFSTPRGTPRRWFFGFFSWLVSPIELNLFPLVFIFLLIGFDTHI